MNTKGVDRCVILRLILIIYLTPVWSEKYILRLGLKLKESYVLRQLNDVSKVQCTVSCTLDTQCRSVSWAPDPQQCLLSERDVALFEWYNREALEPVSGWLTFGVDVYHGELDLYIS